MGASCTFRKSPSLSFMMLALCTAVTFFLLFRKAYPKAYSTVLRDFNCAPGASVRQALS